MLKTNLPVLIVHDIVLFPHTEIKIEIDNITDKKVISLAESYFNNYLAIVYDNNVNISRETLARIGVIAQIKFKLDLPNGKIKISLKGVNRVQIHNYSLDKDIYNAMVTNCDYAGIYPEEELANVHFLNDLFDEYLDDKKSLGNSILAQLNGINSLDELTDIMASFIPIVKTRKVEYVLECNPKNRSKMLIDDLNYELSLLSYEKSLDEMVDRSLETSQKDFILREKLKIINEELGIKENNDGCLLEEKLEKIVCPINIRERLKDEIRRYKLCNSNSPEIGMLRNYIDTLLSLPWDKKTNDNDNILEIQTILENSHYGLNEVKERIIEYMATKKYTSNTNSPIICFVGPPGVGKTSLAKSISLALKRKCVKISVGGINDEAEITGHRRSYVGAAPGKIITGLKKAGVNNPVFIIDEIDKMTKDIKGDPASSLLEVLDKEQNNRFIDHFIEEEFDLSNVMFILTANYIDKIPNELKDRLEIIELSSYTVLEKLEIAKKYIIKKIDDEYNLSDSQFKLNDDSILTIINHYTRESGVRELDRLMHKIARKYIYYKLINNEELNINVSLIDILGPYKYNSDINYANEVGVINALSYTPYGGELVKIESAFYKGHGNFVSSGTLGDMMLESISLSFSFIKSHCQQFSIDINDILTKDFHIHVPCFSTKKEGSSASLAITTAIISSLKNKKISNTFSMTGEITLTGKILKIGGLKEKIIVALANNISTLFLPLDNKEEVLQLEYLYKGKLKVKYIDNYFELYDILFGKN